MKKTIKERVYDYMKEFGSISGLEAYRDLGTFSLREAIRDLKRVSPRGNIPQSYRYTQENPFCLYTQADCIRAYLPPLYL